MNCNCNDDVKDLIHKHIQYNKLCMFECLDEGDVGTAHAHSGAVTGLKLLLRELDGEVEF